MENRVSINVGELSPNPSVNYVIDWKGNHWAVFSVLGVAPGVSKCAKGLDDYRFLVSASNAGLTQLIRPIQDSKLLRLYVTDRVIR